MQLGINTIRMRKITLVLTSAPNINHDGEENHPDFAVCICDYYMCLAVGKLKELV